MSPFYLWIAVLLNIQIYVKSEERCGNRSITGAVGGAVTLPVGRTEFRSFAWSFVGKGGSIAFTSSGGSTSILQEQYEGRLSSTSDGSLIINELRLEDRGTYLVQMFTQKCFYHLTVFNVISEAASVKEDVLGAVGGAVTLNIYHTEATTITWNLVKKAIIIARTKPQGSPEIEDSNYDGRLSSTSDGSLIITELRLEDGGEYRAQFRADKEIKICDYHLTVFRNLTAEDVAIGSNVIKNKTCEVTFTCSVNRSDVTVTWRSLNSSDITGTRNVVFVPFSYINFIYVCTAKNPVSDVSKVVHPWEYCEREIDRENTPKEDYTRVNLIRLVISGCVLLISCCIFIHHMKTEVTTQRPRTDVI